MSFKLPQVFKDKNCVLVLLQLILIRFHMNKSDTGLQSVLNRFLVHISDGRLLSLCTLDGVEILTVARVESKVELNSEDCAALNILNPNCVKSFEQISKLTMGNAQYALSWIDGGVVLQFRLDSLLISLVMEESSNLGLVDSHLVTLTRILGPFSTQNFVSHQL